ncbi:hypothetical protein NP493_138g04006 [Ridgeia piscesae]|uniref:Uncharacterized protein n=1 Tax=Ridgeia piscesae TaxID=27915 RepID=A0AAD9P502_RIDPI|nr:hypothetical protein NP493_138g04006 [Ridgeia piscesae]
MGKSSSMSLNGFNQPPGGSTSRACSDVIRSRSFSSMTNYQRTSSGTTSPMSTPVLGEMFRNPSGSQRSLNGINGANFKKLPKIPNVPRPHRVAVIFDSIKMGLR